MRPFPAAHPLIQAPMAGIQGVAMAAAVCNAGGVGSLPTAVLNLPQLHQQLTELFALTRNANGAININFFCHLAPVLDDHAAANQARWHKTLRPFYDDLGLPTSSLESVDLSAAASRFPFNDAMCEVLESAWHKACMQTSTPLIVSFHFGLPRSDLLARIRNLPKNAKGTPAQIWSSATTVDEAIWLEQRGVDAVIAQGVQAGGHRGIFLNLGKDDERLYADMTAVLQTQSPTLDLAKNILSRIKSPVIAAGAITTHQTLKFALDMGCCAVQVGTAYMLCDEATSSQPHRAALANPHAKTELTNLFTGRPARGIVNRLMRKLGSINPLAPRFPLSTQATAPLRAAAEALGSGDFSPLWSGTDTSGCASISATAMTRRLLNL